MSPSFLAILVLGLFLLAIAGIALWLRKTTLSRSTHDVLPDAISDHVFAKRQQIYRILSGNLPALVENQMCVRHLMTDQLITVLPTCSADEVRNLLPCQYIRHVLVCTTAGKLVGIISDRDLANTSANTAKELMTPRPITVEPDCLIGPAVTLIMKRQISCLPVVKDGEVCGVLTSTDLMMALQCSLQALQRIVTEIANPSDPAEVFPS